MITMPTLRLLRSSMITLALCAGLLCWGPPARADLWAPPQVLTDSGTHSHVASSEDGSLLAAVWRSEAIQVSTSHTGGRLWTTPRPISPAGAVNDLKVCVRGRTIVVVYALRDDPGGIRSVTSTDAGTTWTAPVAVSGDREDFLPQVIGSADGTRVLLAWRHDDGSEHYNVQVASSADSGHTWSPVRSLSAQGFSSGVPRVGLSDDGLRGIVAWGQYEIAFRGVQTSATADGGKTWSDAVSISDPAESGDHPSLGISADGLRATIVWDGSPGVDRYIAAATSSDGGASWNAPTRVSPSGQYGEYPVVSVSSDGLRAVAAWSRYVNPDPTYEVRSAWSSDGGGSWSPDVTLSAQSADSKGPGLVLSPDGRSARAMWIDNAGSLKALQTVVTLDGGASWTPQTVWQSGDEVSGAAMTQSGDGRYATVLWGVNTLLRTRSFFPSPALTAASPGNGPTLGGTAVTLDGSGLLATSDVTMGGVSVPFTVGSDAAVTITTPGGPAGTVDIVLTSPAGPATLSSAFTYLAPPKPKVKSKTTVKGWPKKTVARKGKVRLTVRVKPAKGRKGTVQKKAKGHWKKYHRYTWKSLKRKVTLRAKKGTVVRYRLRLPATDSAKAKTTRVAKVRGL